MHQKLLLTLLLLVTLHSFSQVGINTTSPAAQLEIKASNIASPTNTDGILIPRINTFPATNPTVAQQGMMVYLTTVSGSNQPGFYFWDNVSTTWKSVGVSNPSWSLTGNSGTNPATMFIGTTDIKDLIFKKNNTFSGLIGDYNTSFGYDCFSGNLGWAPNTSAFGRSALKNNQGTQNSAFGDNGLKNSTTGSYNTAVGASALEANVTGSSNTALGTVALYKNISGGSNVAVGLYSLFNNTSGSNNTGIGTNTLFNTTGSSNTAVGIASLQANTNGANNTGVGSYTLSRNTAGGSNTALGELSLVENTTGNKNTGVGSNSNYYNTIGNENTSLGASSLYTNATGNGNTALGTNAMKDAVAGNYNTSIGYNSYSTTGTYSNSTAIGYNAAVSGSNQVRIGDTNITYAGIQIAWSVTSDKRWKKDIQKSNLGLDFISKLNPVSYKRKNDESNKTEYGFIAQELEDTLIKSGIQDSGIVSKDKDGMYSVRYNDLIAPIVKALQEQQTTIETLSLQNKLLENRLIEIEKKLNQITTK
jgi:hypothetical protein